MNSEEHKKRAEQEKLKLKQEQEKKRKMIAYGIVGFIGIVLIGGLSLFKKDKDPKVITENLEVPETEKNKYNSKLDALNQKKDTYVQKDQSIFDMFEDTEDKDTNEEEKALQRKLDSLANLEKQKKVRQTRRVRPKRKTKEVYGNYEMWEDDKKEEVVEVQKPKEEPKKYKPKGKYDFNALNPIEKRRVLLKTGLSQYQESEQVLASVLSSGTIRQGQTITLITKEQSVLSLEKVPRGTTISGIVSFSDNRLNVRFSTIRLKRKKIIKVNLELYGLDGLKGLAIDGDEFLQEQEQTGVDEVTNRTGKLGKVGELLGGVIRSRRKHKSKSVSLGRDIQCILVNKNKNR